MYTEIVQTIQRTEQSAMLDETLTWLTTDLEYLKSQIPLHTIDSYIEVLRVRDSLYGKPEVMQLHTYLTLFIQMYKIFAEAHFIDDMLENTYTHNPNFLMNIPAESLVGSIIRRHREHLDTDDVEAYPWIIQPTIPTMDPYEWILSEREQRQSIPVTLYVGRKHDFATTPKEILIQHLDAIKKRLGEINSVVNILEGQRFNSPDVIAILKQQSKALKGVVNIYMDKANRLKTTTRVSELTPSQDDEVDPEDLVALSLQDQDC